MVLPGIDTKESQQLCSLPYFPTLASPLSLPSQHGRLLTFVPHGKDSPLENMVIERCSWTEGVNRLFEFQVDVLTGLVDFDPNTLIGEEITLGLLQADGSCRLWHAILDESEALGGDGGLARFRLVLRP
jgi:type VI secretion system secreted protein VgrG